MHVPKRMIAAAAAGVALAGTISASAASASPVAGSRTTPRTGLGAAAREILRVTAAEAHRRGISAAPHTRPNVTPVNEVAVVGIDAALWVKRSNSSWINLGGHIEGDLALGRDSGSGTNYYLGLGGDGRLWVRTDSRGWTIFDSTPGDCFVPSAAVDTTNNVLVVACVNRFRQVVELKSGALSGSSNPTLATSTNLGGITDNGPSVTVINGVVTFLIDGTGLTRTFSGWNNLYLRTESTTWTLIDGFCVFRPAIANVENGANGTLYLGCASYYDLAFVWAKQSYTAGNGQPFTPTTTAQGTAGGRLAGGPAFAVLGDGSSATVFAIGTDGVVYQTTASDSGSPAFTKLGGQVQGFPTGSGFIVRSALAAAQLAG